MFLRTETRGKPSVSSDEQIKFTEKVAQCETKSDKGLLDMSRFGNHKFQVRGKPRTDGRLLRQRPNWRLEQTPLKSGPFAHILWSHRKNF